MAKIIREVKREEIEAWNKIAEASRGTPLYYKFYIFNQYLNGKRWDGNFRVFGIRYMNNEHPSDRFYLKSVKEREGTAFYIYFENCAEQERYYLTEMARIFFRASEEV